ncbi:hypothetical protein D3C78_1185090 [compost metagenome]
MHRSVGLSRDSELISIGLDRIPKLKVNLRYSTVNRHSVIHFNFEHILFSYQYMLSENFLCLVNLYRCFKLAYFFAAALQLCCRRIAARLAYSRQPRRITAVRACGNIL